MKLAAVTVLTAVLAGATLLANRAGTQGDSTDVVATVDEHRITVDEYRRAYVDYLLETGLQDEPRRRRDFLDRMIGQRLVVAEGKRLGLDAGPSFDARAERLHDKLLVEFFTERAIYDTIAVSEGDVRRMFVRANTSLRARHLFAPNLEAANALYERLAAGASFDELASQVFADPELAANGGSLGYFEFDEMDPAFEDAAYSLAPGEVSKPVRTAHGYSIIRVDDRKVHPLLTENDFATKKDRMYNYVLHRRRANARKVAASSLLSELNPEHHEAGLSIVERYLTGAVTLADEANLHIDERSAPLVSFDAGTKRETWDVGTFRAIAQETSAEQRRAVTSRASLRQFTEGLLVRREMLRRATERDWHRDERFGRALQKELDDHLYEIAYERLASMVAVPADSIAVQYERHRDDMVNPATIKLREILVGSKAEAIQVKREIASVGFETAAARHTLRAGAEHTGGLLGDVEKSQLGSLADRLFSAPIGIVIGPVEVAGRYALFRVDAKAPARPATLDEVYDDLAAALQRNYLRPFLREHVRALRVRSDIVINEEQLSTLQLKQTT